MNFLVNPMLTTDLQVYLRPNELLEVPGACIHDQLLSRIWLFDTPQAVPRQAPLSIKFSRQEYWNALPFHPPGVLTEPGIKPMSPVSPCKQILYQWAIRAAQKSLETISTLLSTLCGHIHPTVTTHFSFRCLPWTEAFNFLLCFYWWYPISPTHWGDFVELLAPAFSAMSIFG